MKKPSRRKVLAASAAAAAAGVAAKFTLPWIISGRSKPTNIILIIADAMRADCLGKQRNGASLTPNLDRLASDSTVFADCRSASSWTKTSVASIYTGAYPPAHGVETKMETIPSGFDTIPRMAKRAGLVTLAIQTNPWLQAEKDVATQDPRKDFGFDAGFDVYNRLKLQRLENMPGSLAFCTGDLVTKHVVRMAGQCDQPFFLYAHYMDTHQPWMGLQPTRHTGTVAKPRPGQSIEELFEENRRLLTAALTTFRLDTPRDEVPEPVYHRTLQVYDEAAAYLDEQVGSLLDSLKEMGKYNSAAIIFTADHGDAFWEHDMLGHTTNVFDEQVRVPLLIKAPQMEKGPVSFPTSNVNIFRTICDLVETEPEGPQMGLSLLEKTAGDAWAEETIFTQTQDIAEAAWMERKLVTPDGKSFIRRRDANGKLIYRKAFDLARDPGEEHPLEAPWAGSLAAELLSMESRMAAYALAGDAGRRETTVPWQRHWRSDGADDRELSPEDTDALEQLKALGYI